jgi:hypothetical protein
MVWNGWPSLSQPVEEFSQRKNWWAIMQFQLSPFGAVLIEATRRSSFDPNRD